MSAAFDPRALEAKRVGFFGGTFDPPHLGHLFVASEAARARSLEHVVWVPARRSPHKGAVPTWGELRAELIELALCDAELASETSVWRGELDRPEPSFTIDSVRALVAARAGVGRKAGIFLLLGSDQLLGIERWHRPAALFELAEPVVIARTFRDASFSLLKRRLHRLVSSGKLPDGVAQRLIAAMIDPGREDVSATDLRRDFSTIGSVADAACRTTPLVSARIAELGLYR